MIQWINKKRNKKGFTLIELVVVIAILGILAAIAVPRLSGSRDNASRSAVLANLRTIESAIAIAEAEGKLLVKPDNTVITDPTIANLKAQGYLTSEPQTNLVVTSYGISTTKPYQANATVVAKPYGSALAAGTYTIQQLQADSVWK